MLDRRSWLKLAGSAALAAGASGLAPRDESVTIEFWTLALRPWFDDYIRERIAAFEAANPGVRVSWVDVPYDALDRKLIAAAAAGRAPDVVNMSDINFARFVSLGAFRDLTGELPGDPDAVYFENALALCRIENYRNRGGSALLGLPWYLNTQTLLANSALLARGLGPGWAASLNTDWEGLIALAPAFRERTGAFLFSQSLGEESEVPQMLLAHGLPPLREGADGAPEPDWTNPEIRRYLDLWVGLYRSGGLPRESATRGHAHLLDMYQQGQVALANTGPNFVKRIRGDAPAIFEQTVVLPGMTGRLGRGHIPVMVLAVTSKSRHAAAAASLAWFMTSHESQLAFCKIVPILPSTKSTLDDPFFDPPSPEILSGPDGKMARARAVTARSLPDAVAFTCSLETWPDLRRAFQDRFKRVLLDGRDLGKSLEEINADWRKILAAAPLASMAGVPRPSPVPLPRRDEPITSAR